MASPRSIAHQIRKRLDASTLDAPQVPLSRESWHVVLAALDRQGQNERIAADVAAVLAALEPVGASLPRFMEAAGGLRRTVSQGS